MKKGTCHAERYVGLRRTNRDESAPPVIPSVARNLLFFTTKADPSLHPGPKPSLGRRTLGMTSSGLVPSTWWERKAKPCNNFPNIRTEAPTMARFPYRDRGVVRRVDALDWLT